jgi:chemotaxis protein CheD
MIVTPAVKEEMIVVGMGEIAISKEPSSVLTCLGLGSCIALCIYDPISKIGGMVHIVLPQTASSETEHSPAKYADTAVPHLIAEMVKLGALKMRMVVKIAGGAQMSLASGLIGVFKTGERNLEMVLAALDKERLTVAGMDVGGNKGRTVHLYPATGKVTTRSAGEQPREL